jgi:hypothetical protein
MPNHVAHARGLRYYDANGVRSRPGGTETTRAPRAVLRLLDRTAMILPALLSVALLTLWMRSYVVGDRYRWVDLIEVDDGRTILRMGDVWTGEGGVAVRSEYQSTYDRDAVQHLYRRAQRRARWGVGLTRDDTPSYPVRSGDGAFGPLGIDFRIERGSSFDGTTHRGGFNVGAPLWLLIGLTASYPMLRFVIGVIRRERQERIILGLCPRCGVDVRTGPPRCPACGKRKPLLLPQRIAA